MKLAHLNLLKEHVEQEEETFNAVQLTLAELAILSQAMEENV